MRPPGHHALRDRAMGFCYLNNIAIAVLEAVATGSKRVAVFDFDVHHGNGTEAILLDRPGCAFFSIHQFPCFSRHGRAQMLGQTVSIIQSRRGRRARLARHVRPRARRFEKFPARPRRRVRRVRRLRARPAGRRHAAGGGFSLARQGIARVKNSIVQPARRRLQQGSCRI